MLKVMKLTSFTGLGFELNAVLEGSPRAKLSFNEVRDAAQRGVLVEHLAQRLGDKVDLSAISSNEDELVDVVLALRVASEALDGREARKVGVSKNGLCLAMALILDATQQQFG